jgi:hypothetical protein
VTATETIEEVRRLDADDRGRARMKHIASAVDLDYTWCGRKITKWYFGKKADCVVCQAEDERYRRYRKRESA